MVHKNCAGKADVAERVARQMCLAQALARCLEGVVECVRAVSVTEPGFLNFWLRNDKDHHETPSDDPGNGRRDNINCNNFENRSGLHTMQRSGRKTLPGLPLTDVTGLQVVGHTVPTPEYSHDSTADHSGQIHDVLSSPAILTEFSEGSSFSMELVPSRFQAEAYEIFRKYQMTVHRELPGQCNEDAYRRFLVDSPLTKSHSSSSPDHWYGSFHMLYRLAGRLFAVGVVDVLPRCLSSVYLFYDPEFAKLSPGILSALKEIEWVRRCNSAYPSLRFYYMGYYIHSCAKMRYKASFYPSEILCESTKNWIPASAARAVLDLKGERTLRLAPPNMKPAPEASNFEIEDEEATILANESNLQIMFIHGGARLVSLQTLDAAVGRQCPEKIEMIREKLRTFVRLVGKASSKVFMHIL